MRFLKNFSFVILFISVLIIELLLGIVSELLALQILPFLILIFYISTKRFSNSFIFAFFFSGIYYDLFYTSNYFGTTSIKYIFIAIVINFIYNRVNESLFSEYLIFLLTVAIYKFEILLNTFNISDFTNIFLISAINYFLFKIISVTLKWDVFKKSI